MKSFVLRICPAKNSSEPATDPIAKAWRSDELIDAAHSGTDADQFPPSIAEMDILVGDLEELKL